MTAFEARGSMHLGASLFVMALGAILALAVNVEPRVLNLDVTGLVLFVVGAVGLVLRLTVLRRQTVLRDEEGHLHHVVAEEEDL